jgi:hypothetical protein
MGNVGEKAGVAEDLELLADFIADVAVDGMEFFEFGREGVDAFVEGGEKMKSPFPVISLEKLKLTTEIGRTIELPIPIPDQ